MTSPYGTARSPRRKMRSSLSPLVALASMSGSASRDTGLSPSARLPSALSVKYTGFGGRCCGGAVEEGRSTEMSTVARGAATMKMINSTSITSMNGVTLISWVSTRSSSSRAMRMDIGSSALFCRARQRHALPIEIAAHVPHHLRRRVRQKCAIAGDRAREHIVDDDGGDSGDEAERGREQRLGDAWRDHREIRRMRLRDADEAVHDAPDGAEQTDEGCGCANGREHAHAAADVATRSDLDALE